ncbi:MAG: helix-turn-helix domain-containing protein [Spirochaetia bacterium]|jgi:excisionase family DNA binding protein
MDRLCYCVPEAAEQLSISVRSVWRLIHDKKLTTARIGGRVLVPRAALESFLAEHLEATAE